MSYDEDFELIPFDSSLKNVTLDGEIKKIKEQISTIAEPQWTSERELEDREVKEGDQADEEDNLVDSIEKTLPIYSINPDEDYYLNNYIIVGFDESSYSIAGTYAKLTTMKFGECHQVSDGKSWKIQKYVYKPMTLYLEDSSHKIEMYKMGIKKFVDTLYEEFKDTPLKNDARVLQGWYTTKFQPDMDARLFTKFYKIPTLEHVIDRLRVADELLRSVLRMKNLVENNSEQKFIFLGDGISAFRPHIFPPDIFVQFFQKFLHLYEISYFTYSKQCLLRDKEGRFFLPIYRELFPKETVFIQVPQNYSRSLTFIVRLQDNCEMLRFDVPNHYSKEEALQIHKNLIPYSPFGYPSALLQAHKASKLFPSEFNSINVKFLQATIDPNTRQYISDLRLKIIPKKYKKHLKFV